MVVLISIESGKGSVKLMARVVSLTISQRASEILLIAQASGSNESFSNLELVFGQTGLEIEAIEKDRLLIGGISIRVHFFLVADFKVVYSIIGSGVSGSMYPCPWCTTLRRLIDSLLGALFSALSLS